MALFGGGEESPADKLHKKEAAMEKMRSILAQMEVTTHAIEMNMRKMDDLKRQLSEVKKQME